MRFPRRKQEPVELIIIPMIDIVLFLLFFYMMFATFSSDTKLAVSLPEANGVPRDVSKTGVEISVAENGAYSVNGAAVVGGEPKTLRNAIEGIAKGDRNGSFVIAADGRAPHQSVVTVMDVAGQMGFANLSISTRSPSGNSPSGK